MRASVISHARRNYDVSIYLITITFRRLWTHSHIMPSVCHGGQTSHDLRRPSRKLATTTKRTHRPGRFQFPSCRKQLNFSGKATNWTRLWRRSINLNVVFLWAPRCHKNGQSATRSMYGATKGHYKQIKWPRTNKMRLHISPIEYEWFSFCAGARERSCAHIDSDRRFVKFTHSTEHTFDGVHRAKIEWEFRDPPMPDSYRYRRRSPAVYVCFLNLLV